MSLRLANAGDVDAAAPVVARIPGDAPSRGVLVLGMHRSGTSAVSRMLQLAGADLGREVTGASRGNEGGHWEDAFALATHERLLAAFDARWDTPFPLPEGWRSSQAALQAALEVKDYLATTRAPYRCWSVKEPRMCLFGDLWTTAAEQTRLPVAALVVVRHPGEIAASLQKRDGMVAGTAYLLWLEHMLETLTLAEKLPSRVLTYATLLDDWTQCAARIDGLLPDALDFASAAAQIERHLDSGKRHHRVDEGSAVLPRAVDAVWEALVRMADDGIIPQGSAARLRANLSVSFELVAEHLRVERAGRQRALQVPEAGVQNQANGPSQPAANLAESDRVVLCDLERRNAALQASLAAVSARCEGAEGRCAEIEGQVVELSRRISSETHRADAADGRAQDHAHWTTVETKRAAEAVVRAEAMSARVEAAWAIADQAGAMRREADARLLAAQQTAGEASQRADAAERNLHVAARDAESSARRAMKQREELATVLASRSWRLTRPLRMVARMLRGEWASVGPAWRARARQEPPRRAGPPPES